MLSLSYFHSFLPMLKRENFNTPFLLSHSQVCYLVVFHFISIENVSRCVGKVIFSRNVLRHVNKYCSCVSVYSCSSYGHIQQSYPAGSVLLLKLFEIPISLAILYAVERTVCGGQNLPLRLSEYAGRFLWICLQF